MDAFETILSAIEELKERQDATYADLTKRIDAIDRERDIPLNLQQAAVFLGCSTSTMKNYAAKGMIRKQIRNGLAGYLRQDLEKLKRK